MNVTTDIVSAIYWLSGAVAIGVVCGACAVGTVAGGLRDVQQQLQRIADKLESE